MILDGFHFQYGNFNSREHDLIFVHCNTKSYASIMGTTKASTLFNKRDKVKYVIADNFEDSPISFDAEIMTANATPLTHQARRAVEKALFNKPYYMKLYADIADDCANDTYEYIDGQMKRLFFNCRFTNPAKIEDGSGLTVGYRFTMECDSCMAWQDAVEKEYAVSSGDIITVETDTDIGDYTYPDVTIELGSTGGDIIITNNSDDTSRLTKFHDMSPYTTFTMKGNINYISGQYYERFENQNFIRLLDGENFVSIIGDVSSIKFKWNNRRFI